MTHVIPLLKGSALSPRDDTIDSVDDSFIEASADIRPRGGGNDWVDQGSQAIGTDVEQHDSNQYSDKGSLLASTPVKVIEYPKFATGEFTTEQRKPAVAHVDEMGLIPYINCKGSDSKVCIVKKCFPAHSGFD